MQGKGIIKFFLVAMALLCVWQFVLTFPSSKVEKAAEDYALGIAGEENSKVYNDTLGHYLDSVSKVVVWSTPFKDYTYQDLKDAQISYGLDLVGGMSVVMQVDLSDYLNTLAKDNKAGPYEAQFDTALVHAKLAQKNSQADFISLFTEVFEEENPGVPLAPFFLNVSDDESSIDINSSNEVVASYIRTEATKTVKNTYELLRERIDKLGVIQPNVSLDAARDMIIVELPGIKNPQRARDFLTATATLEFWPTYRNDDDGSKIIQAFVDIDDRLRKQEGIEEIPPTVPDTTWVQDSLGNNTDEIASIGTKANPELANQKPGPLFEIFTPNNQLTSDGRGTPVMGYARAENKIRVQNYLAREDVKGMFPNDLVLMWGKDPQTFTDADDNEFEQYSLYGIKKREGEEPQLEGDVITKTGTGNQNGVIDVTLGMNSDGQAAWYRMTKQAFENNKREIGIVLDGEVVSCPSVSNGAISGGNTSITGGFNIQEATDLAKILEIGKLPAKPVIIQEALVGPTLGKENTARSLKALAGGTLILLLFMIAYYGGAGIVSMIALLLNMAFIFVALASLNAVLTLPGIAGIVLTIGMAVDANVIIYERIREELRAGKSNLVAIRDGFSNSYSAIIDANVTTFLVAMVLNYFGLGPIKGFAIVLMVGVVCSIFTAVLVGRMMIDWWTEKDKTMSFWTGMSKNAFANVNYDWIGKRKTAYMVSGLIILAGIGSMFTRGFELGVDFKGGYSYTVQFAPGTTIDSETFKANLKEVFDDADPVVKAISTNNTFAVTTSYLINDNSEEAGKQVRTALFNAVNKTAGGGLNEDDFNSDKESVTHVTSSSKVGPTIADDIRRTSFYAGIFALLVIFLYIMIRFSRWEYSAGAVAALFHDSLIVLSIFSIFHGILPFPMEIDQAFIAAILTVIGYSINDTVVVFDRIREYMNQYSGWSKKEIINKAIDSTISRTVITSLTTLFVIAMLFVFGRGSIQGFAFALLVGVIVGTYSSVFVATPVFHDLSGDLKPQTKAKKKTRGFSKPTAATK